MIELLRYRKTLGRYSLEQISVDVGIIGSQSFSFNSLKELSNPTVPKPQFYIFGLSKKT